MRKTQKLLLAYLLIAVFFINGISIASAQAIDKKSFAHGQKQAETIGAEWLKDYLSYVASDEMEGRDTPSRGLDLTAKFIALHLKQWGVKPAGDNGTYFQRIALQNKTINPAQTSVEFGDKKYEFDKDFLAGLTAGKVEGAPLVFMKNGWIFKAKNINPYKNVDLSGKVVIMPLVPPVGITQADFSGQQGVDYQFPNIAAKENGALAIIEVPMQQAFKTGKSSFKTRPRKARRRWRNSSSPIRFPQLRLRRR